jgi:HAD superfamily hydrolase (TIGR01549 family)
VEGNMSIENSNATLEKYKHIIFDFDGVLAETNAIRIDGFRLLFSVFPRAQVQTLVDYCKRNGGLSRYEKIRYFFEKIKEENIDDARLKMFAQKYSEIVKQRIIEAEPVKGSLEFLADNHDNYDLAIISGSDQEELREICRQRKIDHYFVEILGSPASKERNMAGLLSKFKWQKADCLFVGDSINDLAAAKVNGIDFVGLKSDLIGLDFADKAVMLENFSELHLHLDQLK